MSLLLGISDWLYGLVSIIPKFVYFITMSFVTILDVFQLSVRKLAGLDAYYINGTSEQTGDIAFNFIRSIFETNSEMPALKNAFWGLVILGVILLIVSTIIATIRSEYSGRDNNKSKVIAQSVKSMFLFLIVPVSVFFGLMLSEAFLIALDKATSTAGGASSLLTTDITDKLQASTVNGQTTYVNYDVFGGAIPSNTQTFSGIVFQVASFNANRVRNGEEVDGKDFYSHLREDTIGNLGIFQNGSSVEEMAKMIDEGFAHNVVFDTSSGNVTLKLGEFKSRAGIAIFTPSNNMKVTNLSKFNVALVWVYYDLWMFNYLIAFAFIFALMKVMVNIVIGLMRRTVELVALFMVSPPIVAIMPLDDGKTFKKWRERFLGRALSVIAIILAFNLVFLLLPYLQRINFMDPTNVAFRFVNMLINSVIMIVALVSIEGLIAIISKVFSAEDLNKTGEQMSKEIGGTLKEAAVLTAGAAGVAGRAMLGLGKIGGKAVDKMTGGRAGKLADSTKSGIVKAKDKMLSLGRNKEVNETKEKAEKNFNENSDKIYDEKKEKEMKTAYNESVEEGYEGSEEDFMNDESEEVSAIRQGVEEKFEEDYGTKEEYGKSDVHKKAYINEQAKDKHREIFRERAGKLAGGVNYTKKAFGIDNIQSLYQNVSDEVKDSTIRGGKGGMKSMIYAFLGMSKGKIAKKEEDEKFAKEEGQREKARERVAKEQAEKFREEDSD